MKKTGNTPRLSNFKENAYQRYRNLPLESNGRGIDNILPRIVKAFFQAPPSGRNSKVSPRWVNSRCFNTLIPSNT